MYFLYILLCDNGTLYTGIAKDPIKRFLAHRKGQGAAYTKMHKPLRLLYQRRVGSIGRALRLEKQVKSWTRARKIRRFKLKAELGSKTNCTT
jgi:putative endonuclease